jgi:restriction system protein
MAKRKENILDELMQLPWWVSVCVALVVFLSVKFVIPLIATNNPLLEGFATAFSPFAWFFAGIFLLPAIASIFIASRKRRLLDQQEGIESIRSLSWKQFEELLGEAYRRSGYIVEENLSSGADGGVDLRIQRGGKRYLVQCKQWRSNKVGVRVARELYGVVASEGASGGIIITSGMFTQEARNFAHGKPLDLVEGQGLVDLIRNVQVKYSIPVTHQTTSAPPNPETASLMCPRCGNQLVIRKAGRGRSAGSKFWGCKSFPDCRYTQRYDG